MQMVLEASAQEASFMGVNAAPEDDALLEQAIQESMRANPNPDMMTYEQLSELTEEIGSVSKGYTESQLTRLRPRANFDNINET